MEWRMTPVRRLFLAVSALTVCGCMDFSVSELADAIGSSRVVARIGVIAYPEVSRPNTVGRLKKSLAYFQGKKVDAVVVLGDLTKDGYLNQYRLIAKTWDDVFRNPVTGVDPNPPRRVFVLGDGDRSRYRPEFADELGGDLMQEGGAVEVNGFAFTAMCGRPADLSIPTFYAYGKPALTDELCYYPRTGMAVNAGSLSGVEPKTGYESVKKAASASQGLLVTVYKDEMVVSRLDFGDNEQVAPDWRIPLSKSAEGVRLDDTAPQFWDDTRLMVVKGYDQKEGVSYKVTWPPVLAKHTGVRAFSYEVDAVMDAGGRNAVVKRMFVLSPNFFRSEDRDVEPISCRFSAVGMPEGANLCFTVTPVSSAGARGRKLVCSVENFL